MEPWHLAASGFQPAHTPALHPGLTQPAATTLLLSRAPALHPALTHPATAAPSLSTSPVLRPMLTLLLPQPFPCQVGSDDFDIRVFQDEDVVAEVSEADQIIGLCPVYLTK